MNKTYAVAAAPVYVGMEAAVIGIWSALDAYHDSLQYNRSLRLTLLPEPSCPAPALAMRFDF